MVSYGRFSVQRLTPDTVTSLIRFSIYWGTVDTQLLNKQKQCEKRCEFALERRKKEPHIDNFLLLFLYIFPFL